MEANDPTTAPTHSADRLHESEAHYRQLFDASPDALFVLDSTGKFLDVNQSAVQHYGFTRAELLQMSARDLTVPDLREQTPDRVRQALASDAQFEWRHQHKDGSELPVEISARPLTLDDQVCVLASVRDISERWRMENALRENEQNLQTIFNTMTEGVALNEIVYDAHGVMVDYRIIQVNPAFYRIADYHGDQVIGKVATKLYGMTREFITAFWEQHRTKNTTAYTEMISPLNTKYYFVATSPFVADKFVTVFMDITERKRTEETLRNSETQFRTVFDRFFDAIGVSKSGVHVFVNSAYRALFGYTNNDELVGKPILDLIAPNQREHVAEYVRRRADHAPVPSAYETRGLRKDGTVFDMEVHASTYTLHGDLFSLVILRDISNRKRTEELVRRSEEEYRLLFQNNPNPMWVYDSETLSFLAVNDAAIRHYGYSRDEFLAMTIKDIRPREDVPALEHEVSQLPHGLNQPKIWRHRKKDGALINVEITSHWSEFAGKHARIVMANDVTDRVRAEEQLRASEASLRESQRVAHVGHWVWDTQTNLVTWSDEMKRIFGLDPATFDGDLNEIIARAIHPDDQTKVNAANQAVLTEQRPTPLEYRVVLSDQSVRTIGVVPGDQVVDANGKILKLTGIVQDITERKHAEERVQQHVHRLDALRAIDVAISANFNLTVTLDILLKQVSEQLGVNAAAILLFNPNLLLLEFAAGIGFRSNAIRRAQVRLGESIAGKIAFERRAMHLADLAHAEQHFARRSGITNDGFITYYGVPLIAKGQLKGVLEIFHRAPLTLTSEWMNFLEMLAGQAAIAIDNAQLFEHLQRSNLDLGMAYDATIEGWSRALDLRDRETEGHTQRVVDLTLQMAHAFGIGETDLVHIRRGALLHDIGKLGVPDAILFKPDQLTEEEWKTMRLHPVFAYEMLAPIYYLKPALDIPYCHHEKWDGTGYPRGLAGDQIPLPARIFAVIDVWDALRFDRPYRKAWSDDQVIEYVRAQSGAHFDPRVVKTFLNLIARGGSIYNYDP